MAQAHTKRRRDRERRQRRESILTAARKVFFSQGIHSATMDDVAVAAEVSKGTVYLYFASRETLLAVLLEEGLALMAEQLGQAYSPEESLSASSRLRRLARAYFDFFQAQPHYYRLMMAFEHPKFQQAVDSNLYERIVKRSTLGMSYVVRALEQGSADGDFVVENAAETAGVLWAMLHGVYVILGHPLRREMVAADLESLFDSALNLAIRGLKAPPSRRQGHLSKETEQ